MKIAFLCNHSGALPAIGQLVEKGRLVGLGIPDFEHDATIRVRMLAQQFNIPLTTFPATGNVTPALVSWVDELQPDAVFVLGFPHRIPEVVLSKPPRGFYNFHFGLLPEYRGPDPVFWQIRKGASYGAISVHKMDAELDTGPIVDIVKMPIEAKDNYGVHISKLISLVPQVLQSLLDSLGEDAGAQRLDTQDGSIGVYHSRPTPADVVIDWVGQSADQIDALIRACNPLYGGAVTFIRSAPIRVLQASPHTPAEITEDAPSPGTVTAVEGGLVVLCRDGRNLRLEVIHMEEGFFTGEHFAETFSITTGEAFTLPAMPPGTMG